MRISRTSPGAIAWLLLFVASPVGALEDPGEVDYSAELPRTPPRSVAEALESFRCAPGFEVRCVASEPEVVDPVAIAFDAEARLWVVEMRGYSEQGDERLGRVRRLEDRDGDGHYDTSTIFLEGLSWPTAIAVSERGVFVGAAPDILRAEDVDGDGRSDRLETLFSGFGRGNVQGLLNSFQYGLDGRIYVATSSNGARLRSVRPGASVIELGRRDFAFHPRTLHVEVLGSTAQHGMSFDDFGRRFVCSNSDHLQMHAYDVRRWPRGSPIAAPRSRYSIAADGGQAEVFRDSPVEPWRIVRTRLRVAGEVPGPVEGGGRAAGYFTGSTGVTILRSGALGEDLRGVAIIGDVGSNIVHRKRLYPEGVLFEGRRMDRDSELLASTDTWFRPVQFANGPDGALYIVDMYREVIEHPASLPPAIKRHLDLESGRDRGRIWKLVRKGFVQSPLPNLSEATQAEWVDALSSPRAFLRDTATRLLLESRAGLEPEALEALRATARKGISPVARVHALWVLAGLGVLDEVSLASALRLDRAEAPPHSGLLENAVRLAADFVETSPSVRARLLSLSRTPLPRVRLELALTLAERDQSQTLSDRETEFRPFAERALALAALLARADDDLTRTAVAAAAGSRAADVFTALLEESDEPDPIAAGIESIAHRIGLDGRPAAVARVVERVQSAPESAWATRALRGLLAGLRTAHPDLARELTEDGAASAVRDRLHDEALAVARDAMQPVGARVESIHTLALFAEARDRELLFTLLGARQPPAINIAALAALGGFGDAECTERLIDSWDGAAPSLRSELLEVLLSRRDRALALIGALGQERLPLSALDSLRRRQLLEWPDETVRRRASALFDSAGKTARAAIVERYRGVLELPGDIERGRGHFAKTCSTCHRLEGIGQELGPNLAAAATRGAETLLVQILDPSREVSAEAINQVLLLRDGRVVTGLIGAESPDTLTLTRAGGVTETVHRAEIAKSTSTAASLMPDGLETELGEQGLADVLAYLRSLARG